MIKLRLVGPSKDLKSVILTTKPRGKRGSHVLPVDDKLFGVLEDLVRARRRQGGEETGGPPESAPAPARVPRAEPKISIADMQRFLRAGRSPLQVSREAEVDVAYVEQFFPPILYERAGIVRDAQSMRLSKQRRGLSGLPVGEAVTHNVRSRLRMSGEEIAERWAATRVEGKPWQITFSFDYRGSRRRAVWLYEPSVRRLEPANRLALDLGWVPPEVRRPAATEPVFARRPSPSARPGERRAREGTRKRAGTAKKRAGTAKKRAGTPKKRAGTAKKRAGTAKKRAGTPKKRAGTPKKRAGTPKKRAGTAQPRRRAQSKSPSRAPARARATKSRATKSRATKSRATKSRATKASAPKASAPRRRAGSAKRQPTASKRKGRAAARGRAGATSKRRGPAKRRPSSARKRARPAPVTRLRPAGPRRQSKAMLRAAAARKVEAGARRGTPPVRARARATRRT